MDGNDERDRSIGEGSPQGAEQRDADKAIRDARGVHFEPIEFGPPPGLKGIPREATAAATPPHELVHGASPALSTPLSAPPKAALVEAVCRTDFASFAREVRNAQRQYP